MPWLNWLLARSQDTYAPREAPIYREPRTELLKPFSGPIEIPKSRAEVYKTFGNPGVGSVDSKWERVNLIVAENLPGTWNNGKGRLYCHKLAEPYIREALRRCRDLGCLDYVTKLGCFNFRHQRHDPARPLSDHSWGIALDINPEDNSPKTDDAGPLPEPFTLPWKKFWPKGVSEDLVAAFESVGWSWGGRWKSFCDPMHVSLHVV